MLTKRQKSGPKKEIPKICESPRPEMSYTIEIKFYTWEDLGSENACYTSAP